MSTYKDQLVSQELRRLSPRSPREHEHDRLHTIRRPGFPGKLYPRWRNRFGEPVADHKVTIEQEIAEIRARFEARREYNRQTRVLLKARRHATDQTFLDKSDCE